MSSIRPGQLRAWFDLIRIFNLPIPLAGILAGALAVPVALGGQWPLLILAAVLGCASVQAFNDYEDRDVDVQNAGFRPLPSNRLTPRAVLIGGHVFSGLFALISLMVEPWAALVVVGVYALTRYYSWMKRVSLLHHLMLPAALGLMPIYGALMVHHEVSALACLVGGSIFLLDVNMNIVGAFKDLWDGSAQERVLPVVWGARPAVVTALVAAIVGLGLQFAAVFGGLCGMGALVPLACGLALTLHSRIRLWREPSAEVGYAALKSGRLTECLTFPAVLAGTLPAHEALLIIGALTLFALYAQHLIPEAQLPDDASVPLTNTEV